MVAVSDFSGLISSPCAFASAAAMAPIGSLERCMINFQAQNVEAHRAGLGTFRPDSVTDGFLCIFRQEGLELCLGILVFEVRLSRSPKYAGELGPSVRRAHVNNPYRLDSRARRFYAEEARGLAALHTPPELLFRRQKQVLIERISWYLDLDPFAAAGDDRERRGGGVGDPHIVLDLGHVLLRRRFLRKRPRQHEFGFEHCASAFDDAVQCRRHPAEHRVLEPGLDVFDDAPRRALVPLSVQVAPLPARAGLVGCPNGIAAPIRPAGHAEASAWDRDEGRNSNSVR